MSRPKAVIYTRVSTDKQAEEGTSLEVQESACLRKAQDLGAEVVDILTDEGVSGAFYLSRPGIQKALALLEARKASVLITMKLDRSGRDADVLGLIRKRIVNAGAQLVFVDGANFENNATGNLMFRVSAGFAEYEREVIRERTTGGRRKRAEGGVQPCRAFSPYGYHVVTKQDIQSGLYSAELLGTYQIVEEQAQWVREIFRRYAAGAATRQIKYWLRDQGIPSPNDQPEWSPTTLTRILAHPVYKGVPVFGRTRRRVDETRIGQGRKRTDFAVAREEEEWVYLECQPLVSAEVWDKCQQRLRNNKAIYSGNPQRKYLLAGLVVCPVCRKRSAGTRSGKFRYYTCPYDRKCAYRCNSDCAENAVTLAVNTVIRHPQLTELAARAYNRAHEQSDDTADIERLTRELNQLAQQEKATARAQVDAIMQSRSAAVYDTLLAEIGTRQGAIREQLALLRARRTRCRDMEPKSIAEKAARTVAVVEEVLADSLLTSAEKNRILSTVVHAVYPQLEDSQRFQIYLYGIPGREDTVTQIF
jgi:site-specific DNA recombinase